MVKVGIIGPECTGKSTLASYLAGKYNGTGVPERARTCVEQKGTRDITYKELCAIARNQIEEMKAVSIQQSAFIFFDTELIVTKVWFEYSFGTVPEWLEDAILAYPMDLYLLTLPDLPWTQDGARYNGSDTMRTELFERYKKEIEALGIPYYLIAHI